MANSGDEKVQQGLFPATGHVDNSAVTHDHIATVAFYILTDLVQIDQVRVMDPKKQGQLVGRDILAGMTTEFVDCPL
ncbi:hypothetical protein GCM10023187_43210 [Nibrella viscosa]|uniref:Uncharacterized protein n=1 Tax=Nibrella viscosa TaxID=1084524 RepID=A0ABP8KS82_9BACT